MPRLAFAVVWLLSVASCNQSNPESCQLPQNAGKGPCPATGGPCQGNQDCKDPGLGVCDTTLNGGTCVVCTDASHAACPETMPACVNHACQMCTQHTQCDSKLCLPDGQCAAATDIAYVRPSGGGSDCTDAAPCKTLADGVNTARKYVKIEGAITDNNTTSINGKAVQVYAATGSMLTCTRAGVFTLEVKNDNANVGIYDLEVTGATGAPNDSTISLSGSGTPKLTLTRVKIDHNVGNGILVSAGILTVTNSTISDNNGSGILATSGTVIVNSKSTISHNSVGIFATSTSLTMSQSTVSLNSNGGVSIVGTGNGTDSNFDLTNNFIIGNGGAGAMVGGVFVKNVENNTRRLEFNTIAGNIATMPPGVRCDMIDQDVTFSNNIVWGNLIGTPQTFGTNCNWQYSDIQATVTVTGMGNKNTDPGFIDALNANYHLMPTSMVKDMADPSATLNIDFDGDARPSGHCDMGADEITGP